MVPSFDLAPRRAAIVRAATRVALPFALHGAAREVDRAVGLLLHTTLDLPDFVTRALGLVDPARLLGLVLLWSGAGLIAWAALASLRAGVDGGSLAAALDTEASGFLPLLLRPAVTVVALAGLAVQPAYPYGSTLAVALTQDWAVAQDLATIAALLALRGAGRRIALPAPGAVSVWFVAFLAYALLTPDWARRWDGHPGNEPKTLRMAVAIGHWMTLDVEPVSAGMEDLPAGPLGARTARAAGVLLRETGDLLARALEGPSALGRDAIRATRITRQTIRGKDGGTFHVLAPGPSVLLAPFLRADRAINRAAGTPGRLGVSVLAWNALAALLVAALFVLLRGVTGRPGLAAAVAGTAALLPPFTFYSFQFYPEMPGALVVAWALHALLDRRPWTEGRCAALSLALFALPWLHQKFLPVWAVLGAIAFLRAVSDLVPLRGALALVLPQAVSGGLFLLYNFAITGSARPDALFLAWGPGGVRGDRVGQGLLGLALDARYGLLPYVPVLLLAVPALSRRIRPRGWALPAVAVAVYYVTVAAADNWSGAVCNLGRYAMPALPLVVLGAGLVIARTAWWPGPLALALALGAISAVVSALLFADPHAANDCHLLLARADYADGNVYVPNLFLRTFADAAPGLWARVAAWAALAAVLSAWVRTVVRGRAGGSATRAIFAAFGIVLALGLVLERWEGPRRSPRFGDAIDLGGGGTAFLLGAAVEAGQAALEDEGVDLLVRAPALVPAVDVRAVGRGILSAPGHRPLAVDPDGLEVRVPLAALALLEGRRGVREALSIARLQVDGPMRLEVRPAR